MTLLEKIIKLKQEIQEKKKNNATRSKKSSLSSKR
jgi:hypothetical protein